MTSDNARSRAVPDEGAASPRPEITLALVDERIGGRELVCRVDGVVVGKAQPRLVNPEQWFVIPWGPVDELVGSGVNEATVESQDDAQRWLLLLATLYVGTQR